MSQLQPPIYQLEYNNRQFYSVPNVLQSHVFVIFKDFCGIELKCNHVGDYVFRSPAKSAGDARYANQDPLIRLYCPIQSPLKTQLGVRSFYVERNNNNNNNSAAADDDDDDDGLITFPRVCHRRH